MDIHRDHPDEYFRRLQSYSRSRTSIPQGPRSRPRSRPRTESRSRPRSRPHIDSRTNSYADYPDGSEVTPPRKSKTRPRADSRASSHRDEPYIDPRPRSLNDLLDGSEVTPPKKSKRRQRPDSLASLHPESPIRSRHESYASTRPSSYLSSRPQSYTDTDALTHDFDEKSEYSEKRPKRINKELLRQYDVLQTGGRKTWWTRGRKICVAVIVAIIVLIIIIAGAVVGSKKSFKYNPSYAQVNNTIAFQDGGATHQSVNITNDGVGAGQDVYTYYTGGPSQFPDSSRWVSFQNMWNANLPNIKKSCGWLGYSPDNSALDNAYLFNAIQDRANASLVDHRYILAIVLQESHGCVNVGGTTSSGGVKNPGLMQSHNGDSYSKSDPWLSILLMIQDGVQGTKYGDGLVQLLNIYGDPYSAARGYNSGYIPKSGDLSEAAGATACYVSDVANRLTGWVNAASTCPGGSN